MSSMMMGVNAYTVGETGGFVDFEERIFRDVGEVGHWFHPANRDHRVF
jgi:hypothetical protein